MYYYEIVGYVASLMAFLTFYMRSMLKLRVFALSSNLFFIWYALLCNLRPVLVLHSLLLPLNIYRMLQKKGKDQRRKYRKQVELCSGHTGMLAVNDSNVPFNVMDITQDGLGLLLSKVKREFLKEGKIINILQIMGYRPSKPIKGKICYIRDIEEVNPGIFKIGLMFDKTLEAHLKDKIVKGAYLKCG